MSSVDSDYKLTHFCPALISVLSSLVVLFQFSVYL